MLKLGAVSFVLVGVSVVVGCSSQVGSNDPAGASSQVAPDVYEGIEPGMKVHWQRGITAPQPDLVYLAPDTADNQAHGGGGSSGTSNLVDHGGPVLSSSHTYAIWWGNP